MGRAIIKAGILGGLVIFIWGFISWMFLPWHEKTLHGFKNENAVVEVLKANADVSGNYFLPYKPADMEMTATQPSMFAAVHLEGMHSMKLSMLIGIVNQIIAAILVAWLLSNTRNLTYLRKVGFVVVVALTAGIMAELPNWNWFYFATDFTLVNIADLIIGWFLAGLVMARIIRT